MSYITDKKSATILDQVHKNNLNVERIVQQLASDLSSAGTQFKLIFPYPIRILAMSLSPEAAPSGAVDIIITLTDGTNAITVTQGNAVATPTQEKENQRYEANTALTVSNNAATGATSENVMLAIDYVIEKPKIR